MASAASIASCKASRTSAGNASPVAAAVPPAVVDAVVSSSVTTTVYDTTDEEPDELYAEGDLLPGGLLAIRTAGPELAHYSLLLDGEPKIVDAALGDAPIDELEYSSGRDERAWDHFVVSFRER